MKDLIFERSSPGRVGYDLPALDVPAADLTVALGSNNVRERIADFPEVSEMDVVRHFTRLSSWNYSIDAGMYPLGSCTDEVQPEDQRACSAAGRNCCNASACSGSTGQGNLEILKTLGDLLAEVTGMDAVSLQPPAGASGELAGVMMIRACLTERGESASESPDSGFCPRDQSRQRGDCRIQSGKFEVRCPRMR